MRRIVSFETRDRRTLPAILDPQHAASFRRPKKRAGDIFPSDALTTSEHDLAIDVDVAGDVPQRERHALRERVVQSQIRFPVRPARAGDAADRRKHDARPIAEEADLAQ